jgi:hypothetical protein
MSAAGEKRKPSEVTVEEYVGAAERGPYQRGRDPPARSLGISFSSMHYDLHKKEIFELVYNLIDEKPGKPGPKTKPPAPTVEGAGPNPEWDIEEIKHSAMRRYDAKEARAIKKVNQHIRFASGPVAIFFVGDQHIGNAGSNVRRMYEERDLICATPGAYVWQMGDVIDNMIVGKLMAENFKESAPIMEQWVLAKDYFDGFGDRLVAYCGGNHEAWAQKLSGIDYRRDICPDGVLYDGDTIKATIHVGEHRYRVWSRHKWNGSSPYNPTHGNEKAAKFDDPDFDIYVGAHVHKGAMARDFIHAAQRKMAILTGTYKFFDEYATEKGFPRHDCSTSVGLVLHEDGSFFAATDIKAIYHYMSACYQDGEAA